MADLTATAVRMLDDVIEISRYPLPQQEAEAKAKRRIGLGVTGLADALLFCGKVYGSDEAVAQTRDWLAVIKREAYRTSARLAAERGPFPLYDAVMLETPNLQSLDEETRGLIAEHGLRNGCLTSIAPTGTTSLLAGNVSSGIEPVFAYSYERRILQADGSARFEPAEDYAMRVWRQTRGDRPPPEELFVSAQILKPADHLAMQAAVQTWSTARSRKRLIVPRDPVRRVRRHLHRGVSRRMQGTDDLSSNAITGSVLQLSPAEQSSEGPVEAAVADMQLAPRSEAMNGTTYKLKWPESAHAVYVTINDAVVDGIRRPFEIFVNSKNMDHYAWTLGLTRMISAVFRRGGDVSFVPEELKAVFDPRGGAWMKGRYVPSLLAAIGEVIERHMGQPLEVAGCKADAPVANDDRKPCCPRCGAMALIRVEGCDKCLECGHSKCG